MSVVVSKSYLLSPEAVFPLNHGRIGYQSFAADRSAADVTVSSAQDSFPADAPLRPDTFEKWKPDGAGSWQVDLGQPRDVDYVGVLGELAGVALEVEYSVDGDNWERFASDTLPVDDSPLMFIDEVYARYFRITGQSQFALASVYIGNLLVMQRPFFGGHSPVSLSRQTDMRASMSRGGHFLGQDIVRQGVSGSMRWENLRPGWYRENFDPFVRAFRTRPAFIAWNLRDRPREVIYAWSDDDISPTNVARFVGGAMEVSINIRGVGHND